MNDNNIQMPLSYHLDYLPAFDLTDGLSELLDIARLVIDSENYYMRGYTWPPNGSDTINALENFEGQISIPHGSIILSMTGYSNQTDGFKWELYDNGAKHTLFGRTFGRDVDALGQGGGVGIPDTPVAPNMLTAPMIVMPPGRLTLQLTNLSANNALIQIYFQVAVPITRETLSQDVSQQAKV